MLSLEGSEDSTFIMLEAIGARSNKSAVQVALRWVVQQVCVPRRRPPVNLEVAPARLCGMRCWPV